MAQMTIGYLGEKNARELRIPAGEYLAQWPTATVTLAYCRPTETAPYLVTITMDGTDAVWKPNATDMSIRGNGWCQLIFTDSQRGIIGKSKVMQVEVRNSLGTPGTAPAGMQIYVDTMTTLAGQITGMSAAATTLAAGSDATASYSNGVLTIGVPKGAKGDKGDPGSATAVTRDAITEALGSDVVSDISDLNDSLSDLETTVNGKQSTIDDLDDIRSGAALGSTALQTHQDISGKADVNHTHSYNTLTDKPTIPDGVHWITEISAESFAAALAAHNNGSAVAFKEGTTNGTVTILVDCLATYIADSQGRAGWNSFTAGIATGKLVTTYHFWDDNTINQTQQEIPNTERNKNFDELDNSSLVLKQNISGKLTEL